MPPKTSNHLRLVETRPNQEFPVHRTAESRAIDRAKGDAGERNAAIYLMQHGFTVMKINRFDFDIPEYPAGFFGYENDESGEGWETFVAFDLLVCGTTSFLAEVKVKTASGQHYLLDCIRLQRMSKAYRHASDLQHLFVVFDTSRAEAPANGFFAVTVDQLMDNKDNYRKQSGFKNGLDAYRIPVNEFRPLSHFLKQHNPTMETSNAHQPKPLSFADEAA